MADDHQRRSIRGTTARERIAARRRARRANQRLPLLLALAALAALALLTVGVMALRRAERTLAGLEQEDLRQRATPAATSPTAAPQTFVSVIPASPAASTPSPAPATQRLSSDLLARPFTVLLIGVDRRTDPEEGCAAIR